MGKTEDEIREKLFPNSKESDKILNACFRQHEKSIQESKHDFTYIGFDRIHLLKEKFALHLVSNCQKTYLDRFVSRYNAESLFNSMLCYKHPYSTKLENVRSIINSALNSQFYYIGDTQSDYDMSKELDIGFMHAAYGFNPDVNAEHSFNHLNDIIDFMLKNELE